MKTLSASIETKINDIAICHRDTNLEIKSLATNMNHMANSLTLLMKSQSGNHSNQTQILSSSQIQKSNVVNKDLFSRSRSYLESSPVSEDSSKENFGKNKTNIKSTKLNNPEDALTSSIDKRLAELDAQNQAIEK